MWVMQGNPEGQANLIVDLGISLLASTKR